jgi:hypothetical protein
MSKMKKYNNFLEKEDIVKKLNDLKKSWQDFEDTCPWEFDYFWDKVSAYYHSHESSYKGNRDFEYDIVLEHYQNKNSFIEKDKDCKKRNGYIRVKANTGGFRGGSCWDGDDSAIEYYTGYRVEWQDLRNFIEHILYSIFGKNHAFADIPKILDKLDESNIIHEGNYTNYEYYGNSDDYQWYEVKLWDLYQFLAKEESF